MRVVVDTNVLISAALKQNTPPEAAVHRATGSHLLLKSTITERELFVTRDPPRLVPLPQPVFANSANSTRDVVYA
jgi:predicted nucleic acid-binding protein